MPVCGCEMGALTSLSHHGTPCLFTMRVLYPKSFYSTLAGCIRVLILPRPPTHHTTPQPTRLLCQKEEPHERVLPI